MLKTGSRAPETLTLDTTVTPAFDPVSLLPRHTRGHVCQKVGISDRTLKRYWAELRSLQVLTAEMVDGELHFSDEDVSFLARYKQAKSDRARAGMAETQRERIAQLTAGAGTRQEAEALRRALRAQGEGLTVLARARLLTDRVPALRGSRPVQRLVWYYSTWFQTTDLVRLESEAAPPPSTVERAFREVLASRRRVS